MRRDEPLTIHGYSTALYATWIFVEEMRLLLDAGDGVSAGLLQKARKVDHVALSHADRDHIAGLFQFLQLSGRGDRPVITYPRDCGSFPALAEFSRTFDPHAAGAAWRPVEPGEEIPLGKGLVLRVVPSSHIEKGSMVKSLGYQVVRETRKLRPELASMSGGEIARLRDSSGEAAITALTREIVLGYSGDSGVDPDRWRGCKLLIHESTFLTHADAGERAERHEHSVLGDVLAMARDSGTERLVLTHFSSRYSQAEIVQTVRREAAAIQLDCPIFVLPPGVVIHDLLSSARI